MVDGHTARAFDADIATLRSTVLQMGGLVERQVARAIDAIRHLDVSAVAEVLENEVTVNQMHVRIDLMCNQVIAKRQPIAVDLREIIAILHMINDLERVGDEAKKIAKKVRRFGDVTTLPIPQGPISAMANDACDMLRMALDAFVRQDTQIAAALAERDEGLDRQRDVLTAELLARMSDNPAQVSSAMELIFVVQSLERIGDHAKNIAEYVVTVVEGIDRRHFGLSD